MDQEQELKLSDDETSYRVEVESDINLNQYSILATPASGGATVEYVYPDGRVEGSLENLPLNPGVYGASSILNSSFVVTNSIFLSAL